MLEFFTSSKTYKKTFYIGIFLLASCPGISVIFLLASLLFSLKKNHEEIFKDIWNLPFIISAAILPIICIFQSDSIIGFDNDWDKSLTWIGLANWLPLFACFLGFQYYLKSNKERRKIGLLLVAGCFPVIISGFAQYWFNWYGPFEIFKGLIIWFQKPIYDDTGLSGLFSNQNYAGLWFCIVWPFSLATVLNKSHNNLKRSITITFLILITIAIILTTSRSAWLGLIFLISLMSGISSILFIFIALLTVMIAINISNYNFNFLNDLQILLRDIIPIKFFNEFSSQSFLLRETRYEIWMQAISFILQKPIFGWGAASFPILYYNSTGMKITHSHNLLLEMSNNYGLIITLLVFISIFIITILSFKKIFLKNDNTENIIFQKAWFAAFLTLLFSQQIDVQYFDFRISIIFWILLAGLKNKILEDQYLEETNN